MSSQTMVIIQDMATIQKGQFYMVIITSQSLKTSRSFLIEDHNVQFVGTYPKNILS